MRNAGLDAAYSTQSYIKPSKSLSAMMQIHTLRGCRHAKSLYSTAERQQQMTWLFNTKYLRIRLNQNPRKAAGICSEELLIVERESR